MAIGNTIPRLRSRGRAIKSAAEGRRYQRMDVLIEDAFSESLVSNQRKLRERMEERGSEIRRAPREPERLPISDEIQIKNAARKILKAAIKVKFQFSEWARPIR